MAPINNLQLNLTASANPSFHRVLFVVIDVVFVRTLVLSVTNNRLLSILMMKMKDNCDDTALLQLRTFLFEGCQQRKTWPRFLYHPNKSLSVLLSPSL